MSFWFTFFLWVASFVISDYFRAKLPAQEPSGEGDFQSPTATEGRKVPQVVGGTVKIKGPNTLFYGDWEAEAVTVETGLIFKRDETVGYLYRVALALGQFQGRAAGMTAIYIGDDKVWDYVADNGSVPGIVADIDLPELFGGETQGGGFVGRVRAFTGENNQPVSTYLAGKNPLQSAWPGFVYVVVTDFSETAGANLGESNQLRDIRVEWQNYDTIANGGLGNDLSLTGDKHIIGRDANPISAAYKVLNDPDFSIATGDINTVNFQAVADVCYTEGIGYSQVIDSELEAYEILAEIEKHIDGYIGPNPTNGLLEVKLARNDYTAASEYQATEANIVALKNYAKPEWPQTKNEVKLRFVNRDKDYTDDHAVAQDMAGRLIAGRPQSLTIRFPGVRDADVANLMVTRTSRGYFWPIAKFELELDRTAYALRPGDIVMVTHSDINATDLPTRITRVRTGDLLNQTIKVDVVEDVFQHELVGLAAAPPASGHVAASSAPVTISVHENTLAPRWLMEINEQTLEPRLLFLVAKDLPNSGYRLSYRTRAAAFGGNFTQEFQDGDFTSFTRYGILRAQSSPEIGLDYMQDTSNDGLGGGGLGQEFYVDGSSLDSLVGTYDPAGAFNGLICIDPGGTNEEFMAMTTCAIDGVGVKCSGVIRGIGDTPIKQHAVGEAVFFIDTNAYLQPNAFPDDTNDSFGYQYKIGPIAPDGVGTITAFQTEQLVDASRYNKPYPPTALLFYNLSTSFWYPNGTIEAWIPDSITAPTASGVDARVANRRFDQSNPIYGANSRDDLNAQYLANSFADYNPTLKWWLYDLDTYPSPVRGDAFASGSETGRDDLLNQAFLPQTLFQDEATLSSPANIRFEFAWQNAGSPLVDPLVPAGVESNPIYMDKQVQFFPGPFSYDIVADTALLIHFNGNDKTQWAIDESPYEHTVTISGIAELDVHTSPLAGGLGSAALYYRPFPFSPLSSESPQTYVEVTDLSPQAFDLNAETGYTIQCRVKFTAQPTTGGDRGYPLITKWRESDNERGFWFGLSSDGANPKGQLKLDQSSNGTTYLNEFTVGITWNTDQWYELTACVFNYLGVTNTLFFIDGVFRARQSGTLYTDLHKSEAPLLIGSDGDGNHIPENIRIDEVRIIKLPLYTAPYSVPTTEFPGRNRYKVLHCNWENATGSPESTDYNTDDLNRMPVNFPLNEVTAVTSEQSKFGTNSLYVGGVNATGFDNSDGVVIPNTDLNATYSDNWDFYRRDFTMECFVRFEVALASQPGSVVSMIVKRRRGVSPFRNWVFYWQKTGELVFNYRFPAGNDINLVSTTQAPAINTWYHCAVCRKDGVLSLFFEGNRIGQDLTTFDVDILNWHDSNVSLGRMENNTTAEHWVMQGWLDEVRVLNGEAAYDGATYTVPTAPFPVDDIPPEYIPPSPQSPSTPPSPQSPITPAASGTPSNWQPSNL